MNKEDPGYLAALKWFIFVECPGNRWYGTSIKQLEAYEAYGVDTRCPALDCAWRVIDGKCKHAKNPNNMSLEELVLEDL